MMVDCSKVKVVSPESDHGYGPFLKIIKLSPVFFDELEGIAEFRTVLFAQQQNRRNARLEYHRTA